MPLCGNTDEYEAEVTNGRVVVDRVEQYCWSEAFL